MANFIKSGDGIYSRSADSNQLDNVLAKLEAAGANLPSKKKKAGLLQRLGLLLNTASPTSAIYKSLYEGANPLAEYAKSAGSSVKSAVTGEIPTYDFKTGKDILVKEGMADRKGKIDAADLGGLAIDILTDPTTYLTAGTAKGGATILGEGGKVALSKTGTSVLDDALRVAGKSVPREAVEREVAKLAAETPELLAKRGIRLAGQTVVPGAALDKVGLSKVADKGITSGLTSTGLDLVEKIPVIGESFGKGRTGIASLFDNYAAIKKALPKDQADRLEFLMKNMQRTTAGEQNLAVDEIIKLAQKAQKESPEAGQKIMAAIETQLKPSELLDSKLVAEGITQQALPMGQEAIKELGQEQSVNQVLNRFSKMIEQKKIGKELGQLKDAYYAGVDEAKDPLLGAGEVYYKNKAELAKPITATTSNETLDEIGNKLIQLNKDIFKEESSRGLIKSEQELEGYMTHIWTPEAKKAVAEGTIPSSEYRLFSEKLASSKKRGFNAAATEINAEVEKKYGIKLFEEDAFKSVAHRKVQSIRATNVADLQDDVARELGMPATKNAIEKIDGVTYVQSSLPRLQGTMIPKEVEELLVKTEKTFNNDESISNFLKIYDKSLNFWKGSVTGLFPAFHSRNFLGGTFNNFLAGVTDPTLYGTMGKIRSGADGEIKLLGGRKMSFQEVRDLMTKHNISGQSGILDAQGTVEEAINKINAKGVGATAQKVAETPQKVMSVVEDELRGTLFIDRLMKGDSVGEATDKVMKYHFDYSKSASTSFENNIAKRIAPFYNWTRNNIPLQFEQLGQQPGKYAAVLKTMQATQPRGEQGRREQEFMPEWMQNQLNFRLPGDKAKYANISLPLEDLTKVSPKEAYGLLSPFIKAPIELLTNKNVFMDSKIYDETLPEDFQTSKAPEFLKAIPDPIRKLLNIKEVSVTNPTTGEESSQVQMDSKKLYLMRSALGRFVSTADDVTADKPTVEKILKNLAGISVRTNDVDQQEYFQAKDYDQMASAVLSVLRKQNLAPTTEEENSAKTSKIKKTKKIIPVKASKTQAQKNKEKSDDILASFRKAR